MPAGPFLTAQYSWFVPLSLLERPVSWIMMHRDGACLFASPPHDPAAPTRAGPTVGGGSFACSGATVG